MIDDPVKEELGKADAEQPRSFAIYKNDGSDILGLVTISLEDIGDIFDFALTPVVSVPLDKDDPRKPKIQHFMASPRTQMDTRQREEDHPFHHVGDPPRES
jgi:hypothetical protein